VAENLQIYFRCVVFTPIQVLGGRRHRRPWDSSTALGSCNLEGTIMLLFTKETRRRAAAAVTATAFGLLGPAVLGLSGAQAADRDRDDDGMPNRWENTHGLNPDVANANRDKDHDGLRNLAEFTRAADPADEDTDNDGHDDGDEVRDGVKSTDIDDPDTDDDGVRDGDEDANRDGEDNEDEDDAGESCRSDDDDRDGDNVDNEDENELGSTPGDPDFDNDGIPDGEEDADEDGESNEDEDDSLEDECSVDGDGDGEADEDEGDRFATIDSFNSDTGTLVVTTQGGSPLTVQVTADTEVEFENGDEEGTLADLQPGVVVAELDIDDETGTVEEIEIYQAKP